MNSVIMANIKFCNSSFAQNMPAPEAVKRMQNSILSITLRNRGLMDFGNLREKTIKIENDTKLCVPSGKRRMHSVSGRLNDDR